MTTREATFFFCKKITEIVGGGGGDRIFFFFFLSQSAQNFLPGRWTGNKRFFKGSLTSKNMKIVSC